LSTSAARARASQRTVGGLGAQEARVERVIELFAEGIVGRLQLDHARHPGAPDLFSVAVAERAKRMRLAQSIGQVRQRLALGGER
jgi:hypothetical protein